MGASGDDEHDHSSAATRPRLLDELGDLDTARTRPLDAIDVIAIGGVASVAFVAVASLSLAYLGMHSWWAVSLLSVLGVAPLVVRRRRRLLAGIRRMHPGAFLLVPILLVAAVLFLPGYRYATSDKDPGIYVLHGLEIASTGDLRFDATPLQESGALTVKDVPGAQWRGFGTVTGGAILPSFFHLWPALLGTVFDLVGFGGLAVITPLLGLLSIVALFAAARRLGGLVAGLVSASVLAVNMMNVWQARYPTAEMLGQLLFVGGVLSFVVAVHRDDRLAAGLAGALVAVGFLNRGEVVAMSLLVAAAVVVAEVTGRQRAIGRSVAIGLALPMPLALYQAYGPAARYATGNGVPSFGLVGGLFAVAVVAAVAVPRLVPRLGPAICDAAARLGPRIRVPVGVAIVGGAGLALARPVVFGEAYLLRNGELIRSYDELSVVRLALFFGWVALTLAVIGAVWVFAARPRADRVLAIGIGFLFLVLFVVRARNSPQMMWWGRRFVPVAVPTLAVLIGLSSGAVLRVVRSRAMALTLIAALSTVTLAEQSLHSSRLLGHSERAGSYTLTERIAATAGGTPSLFLWERGTCCGAASHLLGSARWARADNDSAQLPESDDERVDYLRGLREAVGDMPILLVLEGDHLPPAGTGLAYETIGTVMGAIPAFEESDTERPSRAIALPIDVTVYRVIFDA